MPRRPLVIRIFLNIVSQLAPLPKGFVMTFQSDILRFSHCLFSIALVLFVVRIDSICCACLTVWKGGDVEGANCDTP